MKDLISATILCIAAAAARGATWNPMNTGLAAQHFGINAIVPDPVDPATVYAIVAGGALYKTGDGAATWQPVGGVAGVNGLAIDPSHAATIYAITTHGILKTTDAGQSWAAANGGLNLNDVNFQQILIDPVNPSTVYALEFIGHQLLKTTDGAATWTVVHDFGLFGFVAKLVVDPVTPSTLYAGMDRGAIIKSTDGGFTWTQTKPGNNVPVAYSQIALAVDPSNSSTIYAGSFTTSVPPAFPNQPGAGAISKSTDGGQTWRDISSGIPADAFVRSFAVDPSNPTALYAGYFGNAGSGLLMSTDEGETWTVISNAGPIAAVGPGALYAGGTGILQSVDAGSTWHPVNAGLDFIDMRVLAVDPVHPGALYTGGAGGIFERAAAGAAWTGLTSPPLPGKAFFGAGGHIIVRTLAIDPADTNVLYVNAGRSNGCSSNDNVIFKSTDAGATWSDSISPPGTGCSLGGYFTSAPSPAMIATFGNPPALYLAVGEDDDEDYALLKSTDGGANWNNIWDPATGLQTGINTLVVDRTSPNLLYAGLGDHNHRAAIGFFKSTDGGATWSNIGLTNTAVIALAPDLADSNTIYAVSQGVYTSPVGFRGVFKTTDGGATWSAANNGLDRLTSVGATIVTMAVDPVLRGTVYAATSGDGVYRTVDGGASWAAFNDGLTSFDIRALAIASDGLYAATATGVFKVAAADSR